MYGRFHNIYIVVKEGYFVSFAFSSFSFCSFKIALRDKLTRPCLSISITLTRISSPIFTTSSTFPYALLQVRKYEQAHLFL